MAAHVEPAQVWLEVTGPPPDVPPVIVTCASDRFFPAAAASWSSEIKAADGFLAVADERRFKAAVSANPSSTQRQRSCMVSESELSADVTADLRSALDAWLRRMEREHVENLRTAVDLILEDWTAHVEQKHVGNAGAKTRALSRFRAMSSDRGDATSVHHSETFKKMETATRKTRPLHSSTFARAATKLSASEADRLDAKNTAAKNGANEMEGMSERKSALLHFRQFRFQRPRHLRTSPQEASTSSLSVSQPQQNPVHIGGMLLRFKTEKMRDPSAMKLTNVSEIDTQDTSGCRNDATTPQGGSATVQSSHISWFGCCPRVRGSSGDWELLVGVEKSVTEAARGWSVRLTYSKWFCLFRLLLIFFDMACIGSQVHCRLVDEVSRSWRQANGFVCSPEHKAFAFWGDVACFVCFASETGIHVVARGWKFLRGSDASWNIFDVAVLAFSAGHFAWDTWPNLTFLRLFRAAHLLTRVRALEKALRQFRLTLMVLRRGIQPLSSTILAMAYVIYIFAVLQSSLIFWALGDPETASLAATFDDYWGTFPRTLRSMMMALTGGQDWNMIVAPLEDLSLLVAAWFYFFIVVIVLGVMNVVTGLFVDRAMDIQQQDRDTQVKEQIEQEDALVKDLRKIFHEADADSSGLLSWDEFNKHLQEPRILATLASLDLDVSEAQSLFRILDYSGSGEVNVHDFVWGFMRLKGNAKSADLCTLLYEHRQLKAKLADVFGCFNDRLDELECYMAERHLEMQAALEQTLAPQVPAGGALESSCEGLAEDSQLSFDHVVTGESFEAGAPLSTERVPETSTSSLWRL